MELADVLGLLYRKENIRRRNIRTNEKRTQARKDKNYQLADEIRDGVKIENNFKIL